MKNKIDTSIFTKRNSDLKEYEQITEFSFVPKKKRFVVRFLDGNIFHVEVKDLPHNLLSHNPDWEYASLSPNRSSIIVKSDKDDKEIKAYIIHSKGKPI